MQAFIWRRVERLTSSWHHEGGLLIVARDLDRARVLLAETLKEHRDRDEGDQPCGAMHTQPDAVLELAAGQAEQVWSFPDAGCC